MQDKFYSLGLLKYVIENGLRQQGCFLCIHLLGFIGFLTWFFVPD